MLLKSPFLTQKKRRAAMEDGLSQDEELGAQRFWQLHLKRRARQSRGHLEIVPKSLPITTWQYGWLSKLGPVLGPLNRGQTCRNSVPKPYTCIWVLVKIMVPFLGPLNTRCRTIRRTQKRTIMLTTTHPYIYIYIHIQIYIYIYLWLFL